MTKIMMAYIWMMPMVALGSKMKLVRQNMRLYGIFA